MSSHKSNFNETAEEYFEYYLYGNGPIRVTIFMSAPVLTEIIDLDQKSLIIDNSFIIKLAEDSSATEISKEEFDARCNELGVKPERLS